MLNRGNPGIDHVQRGFNAIAERGNIETLGMHYTALGSQLEEFSLGPRVTPREISPSVASFAPLIPPPRSRHAAPRRGDDGVVGDDDGGGGGGAIAAGGT